MKRRNRKLRKTLLTLCCALSLVAISVGATLAYLTDTEGVTNTFTVGHVNIMLDEAKVGEDGKELIGPDAQRVTENKYHLLPGMTYDKDPTIHVVTGSEDAYVVAKIVVTGAEDSPLVYKEGNLDLLGIQNVVTGGVFNDNEFGQPSVNAETGVVTWDSTAVKLTQQKVGDNFVFMVYYKNPVLKTDTIRTRTLFENLVIPEDWDNADIQTLGDLNIDITAYAMQSAGFKNVDDAYAACDGKWQEYTAPETTTP